MLSSKASLKNLLIRQSLFLGKYRVLESHFLRATPDGLCQKMLFSEFSVQKHEEKCFATPIKKRKRVWLRCTLQGALRFIYLKIQIPSNLAKIENCHSFELAARVH